MMLPLLPFLWASINRHAKAWWFYEVADAVAKRQKASTKAHCSEEDRQNYISISRYTSTVISKAKAESWQNTCSSLSPKTCPSEVFSLLRSISGSLSSTSSDLLNFPNCHTAIDCANQLYSHLQSHFSTQTPKPFRSTEKIYINTMRTVHCNACTPLSAYLSPLLNSLQLSLNSQSQPHQALIKLPTLL